MRPIVGPVEAIPGIWESDWSSEGIICVVGDDEFDSGLERGTRVAEVMPASIRTQVCQECGSIDTDALLDDGSLETCSSCSGSLVLGPDACKACGAGPEAVCVLSYAGCGQCRPERLLQGSVRRGPAAGLLARAGLSYAAREAQQGTARKGGVVAPRVSKQTGVIINDADPLMNQPVFHIVEEPGGIRRLSECEVPNEI